MPALAKITSFWLTLTGASRLDSDLDDELRDYLREIEARKIAEGLPPEAARRAALLETGGIDQIKEQVRDIRIGQAFKETLRDVGYAWRMLRKSPAFSCAAIATLALGVGATTAIFSVVNTLLIEPLPYHDASKLVFVWADQSKEGYARAPLSGPELNDLDTRTTRFEGFGAIWSTTAALPGDNEPEQLRIGLVSVDFFSLLGVDAALGRTFTDTDSVDGPPPSILLGPAVWQRRFGGDPNIVGRRIQVNGQFLTVIGVMPPRFRLMLPPDAAVPDDLEAWLPLGRRATTQDGNRGHRYLRVIGRLRDGVSLAVARDDIARVGREISQEYAHYGSAGRQFETVALKAD